MMKIKRSSVTTWTNGTCRSVSKTASRKLLLPKNFNSSRRVSRVISALQGAQHRNGRTATTTVATRVQQSELDGPKLR
jgi:hypothetical protein